jgi:hypothetical protein
MQDELNSAKNQILIRVADLKQAFTTPACRGKEYFIDILSEAEAVIKAYDNYTVVIEKLLAESQK